MIYGKTRGAFDCEGGNWSGALSASGFRGHPQSAMSVPSFVKFPLFSGILSHGTRKKAITICYLCNIKDVQRGYHHIALSNGAKA